MKRDIGFRFDGETHERLSALAQEWGCTRTAVIERLLAWWVDSPSDGVKPRGGLASKPIPTYLPGKPIADATIVGPITPESDAETVVHNVPNVIVGKPLTRAEREAKIGPVVDEADLVSEPGSQEAVYSPRVDPDKVAAFQRKMAQAQKGKKR